MLSCVGKTSCIISRRYISNTFKCRTKKELTKLERTQGAHSPISHRFPPPTRAPASPRHAEIKGGDASFEPLHEKQGVSDLVVEQMDVGGEETGTDLQQKWVGQHLQTSAKRVWNLLGS